MYHFSTFKCNTLELYIIDSRCWLLNCICRHYFNIRKRQNVTHLNSFLHISCPFRSYYVRDESYIIPLNSMKQCVKNINNIITVILVKIIFLDLYVIGATWRDKTSWGETRANNRHRHTDNWLIFICVSGKEIASVPGFGFACWVRRDARAVAILSAGCHVPFSLKLTKRVALCFTFTCIHRQYDARADSLRKVNSKGGEDICGGERGEEEREGRKREREKGEREGRERKSVCVRYAWFYRTRFSKEK